MQLYVFSYLNARGKITIRFANSDKDCDKILDDVYEEMAPAIRHFDRSTFFVAFAESHQWSWKIIDPEDLEEFDHIDKHLKSRIETDDNVIGRILDGIIASPNKHHSTMRDMPKEKIDIGMLVKPPGTAYNSWGSPVTPFQFEIPMYQQPDWL